MPVYVRLAKEQTIEVPQLDFGRNLAPQAALHYSAAAEGDPNGSIEPQTLELTWSRPQKIGKVILWGLRADNQFCALLEYDLQYHNGTDWVTLEKVRTSLVPTETVETSLSTANTWLLDDNLFVHEFRPITTDHLRLSVLRTTCGFVPDDRSRAWGKAIEPRFMLRRSKSTSRPVMPSRRNLPQRTIQAAVLRQPGEPLAIEELKLEGPRDDEVLVRIVASGICHTDIGNSVQLARRQGRREYRHLWNRHGRAGGRDGGPPRRR